MLTTSSASHGLGLGPGLGLGMATATTEDTIADADSWRLVRRAQRGDIEAFGQLYQLYVDSVRSLASRLMWDNDLADDLTSETFLRALRSIGSLSFRGVAVRAWLMTIARNIARDHHKSACNRFESPSDDLYDQAGPSSHDPAQEAIDALQAHSSRLMLRQSLAALPAAQRDCLVLRFYRGLSVADTAVALRRSQPAVRQLQHRAIRSLATALDTTITLAS